MTREKQMFQAVEQEHGKIYQREAFIALTAMEWADKTMIDKACNIFCHTGCPHKTDSYNCLNNKCDAWKIFRRMMEEST